MIALIETLVKPRPGTVNEDPAGRGWFMKLKLADAGAADGLMDQAAYDAFIKDEH